MGTYLNPGAQALRDGRNSKIYVDKSLLLAYLDSVIDTEQKYVCVSRPRRFGKSMAANMVCAYYDRTVDRASEFAGLAIAGAPSFEQGDASYDVVRIDMQSFLSKTHDVGKMVEKIKAYVLHDLRKTYPDVDLMDPNDLTQCMADCWEQTHRRFVVVIDEWDCVMREMQADHEEQRRYLDWLREFLKGQAHVALAYMTGILPIKKYGTHSALNMFSEFSMVGPGPMAPHMGFTQAEVRELCGRWGCSFEECRAWYDGYRLRESDRGTPIEAYSPRSVVEALTKGSFGSYWNSTETYEALKAYIDMDFDGLHTKVVELVSGARVPISIGTYANDMMTFSSGDDVLTLLVHLGYLGYDADAGAAFVPNREVMEEFANSTRDEGWSEVARAIRDSEGLLGALLAEDAEAVAAGVERAHEDASSVLTYNDENSLACTLRLAFFSAIRRWRIVREAPAGKGYADLVLVPLPSQAGRVPGVVIELKYGDSPEAALAQIRERGYERSLEGLVAGGGMLLCGIAYDPKKKSHAAVIERA